MDMIREKMMIDEKIRKTLLVDPFIGRPPF
jgi:hypothetical protein